MDGFSIMIMKMNEIRNSGGAAPKGVLPDRAQLSGGALRFKS